MECSCARCMDRSALQELFLEGNPVALDSFHRSKVLSSLTLPCLKSIDGAPVKSRLSGQLKYSDLRASTHHHPPMMMMQSSRRGGLDESRCSSASSGSSANNQSAVSYHCPDDGSTRPITAITSSADQLLPGSAECPPSGEQHSYSDLLVDPLQFATQLVNSTPRGQLMLPMMMRVTTPLPDEAGHDSPPCEPSSIDQSSTIGDHHFDLDRQQDYEHYLLQLSTLPWRRPPAIKPNYSCGGAAFKYSKSMGSPSKAGTAARPPSPSPRKMIGAGGGGGGGGRVDYSAQKIRKTNDAAPAVRLEAAPAPPPPQQQVTTAAAHPNEWMAPILKERWQQQGNRGRGREDSSSGLALPLPPPTASRSISLRDGSNTVPMQRNSASKIQRTAKGPTASASNSPTRSSLIRSSFISTAVRSKQETDNIEQALINDRRTTYNSISPLKKKQQQQQLSSSSSSNQLPAASRGNNAFRAAAAAVGRRSGPDRSAIVDVDAGYSQNKSATAQHLIDSQEYRPQQQQDSRASLSQEYRPQQQQDSRASLSQESPYRRFLTLRDRLTNKLTSSSSSDAPLGTDELSCGGNGYGNGYSESKSGAALQRGIDTEEAHHTHTTYGFASMLTPDDVDAIFSDGQLGSTTITGSSTAAAARREHVTELKKIESKVDSLSLQDRLMMLGGNPLGSAVGATVAPDTLTHPPLTQTSNSELNGYGLLYSMIQQRKTILDSISINAPPRIVTAATAAPPRPDDKDAATASSSSSSLAKDPEAAVSTRAIYDAIGKLKERQLASFQELYGTTTAPPLISAESRVPALHHHHGAGATTDRPDDLWSLGRRTADAHTVQHSSIPPANASSQSNAGGGNMSFLDRFVENNPYMRLQQQQRPAMVQDSRQLVWASNGYL